MKKKWVYIVCFVAGILCLSAAIARDNWICYIAGAALLILGLALSQQKKK